MPDISNISATASKLTAKRLSVQRSAWFGVLAGGTAAIALMGSASAETIASALARAYGGNPDLNSQRAAVRASDEEIPRAMSGYRPRVTATADAGLTNLNTKAHPSSPFVNFGTAPRGYGVSITQNIWNGNRTANSLTQAESRVLGARETMRNTEQSVLSDGATFYMNVLRDTAILDLNRNNIAVLEEQLRQTNDRFKVGEVTRTDVAQSQSNLAKAQTDYFTARSNLQTSIANFRQVIGVEPRKLEPAKPLDRLLPRSLNDAIGISQAEHPAIQALLHGVDAAQVQVKLVEGELYPTIGLTGTFAQRWDQSSTTPGGQAITASIVGQISVPIYEGGEVYARTRQAKETLGQQRLQTDLQRDKVRALVVSSWGLLENAKKSIESTSAAVRAAEVALNGVREEAKVGQRTTLDVLNAQQTLVNARVSLVTAQRDRVVNSYLLLSAVGRLSAANLALNVTQYNAQVHFDQVKGKWFGLRTPDGR